MKIKYIQNPEIFFVENQNIEAIAEKFGVSVFSLERANGLSKVKKGTILHIPNIENEKGEIFSLHKPYGQENSYKKEISNHSSAKIYVVKPADTLVKIANKLGVSKEWLIEKNNTKTVFIGQILHY